MRLSDNVNPGLPRTLLLALLRAKTMAGVKTAIFPNFRRSVLGFDVTSHSYGRVPKVVPSGSPIQFAARSAQCAVAALRLPLSSWIT